jgi:hypothetical protein
MNEYGVYRYGGSVGNSDTKLVVLCDSKDAAKKSARSSNAVLTTGEKKYFGMKYKVQKTTPEDIQQYFNIPI